MIVFDSADHAEADRVDVARTVFGEQAAPSTVTFAGETRMVAVMEAWRFGRVNLFCASMTGNQLTRSRRNIRSGPAGNVAVAWQEFGVARFEQHGRRREVRPGNLMLVDLDRPYGFSWPGWGRSRCLNVPLAALGTGHDELRRAADRLGHSPVYPLLRRHIRGLCLGREDEVPSSAADSLGNATIALVRALIETAAHDDPPMPDHDGVRDLVGAVIDSRLHDPDLDAASVTASCGLSRVEACGRLAESGIDLDRWIAARRVAAAGAALRASDVPPDADFAMSLGFSDLRSFVDAFVLTHGMTPRLWWEAHGEP